uniref:Uncharacterized protein n=1 Tax=viral metagenome TaxID=1070528 RepID=A0A6M3JI45_9ZZZZ
MTETHRESITQLYWQVRASVVPADDSGIPRRVSFGLFTSRERAEGCLMIIAGRINVIDADIVLLPMPDKPERKN